MEAIQAKIRTVIPGDLEDLTSFWRTIDGVGLGKGDDLESLRRFILRNPTTCFLIRDEGKVVGSVLGGFDGRRGYVYHLAVCPEKRRQGLGRILMDTVCRELEKQGAHKVHLFVFNENLEAIGFYQRLGWNRRTDIQVMSSDRSFITNTID
ncbi:MAG: GNAT family N-acetyltransferase [Syntrophomonadales bacterium]|jgi:ribosomal protein S18 acetylase RimI-like enzyme